MGAKKSTKVLMGLFLAGLMVLSIAGIIGSSINQSPAIKPIEYNGYSFYYSSGGYFTTVGGRQIQFTFLPEQIENLSNDKIVIAGEKVYISVDPALTFDKTAAFKRLIGISSFVNVRAVPACTKEEGCVDDVPIASCPDDALVLQIKNGPTSIIAEDLNCYTLQAEDELELYKLAEYVSYTTFGII